VIRRKVFEAGEWALRLVTHNFLWKLLSLAGAVAIWALVASEPELSTFDRVRLEFRNLPSDIEVASSPLENVTLELRGPAGELRGPAENRLPAVVLDMSDAAPGQRSYQIGDGNVSLPRGVRLVRSFPSEVRFDFERRATRAIPVQVRFEGEAAGYVLAGYTVSPTQLQIEGPASHVARTTAAVTDPVDLSTKGDGRFRVNAFVPDSYVRFEDPPEVVVTVRLKRR
jgi:YbbR domain-containing protein